jgi:hypothetical protein
LQRLVETEKVSVYCDANADISHVAPRGTESDANYLATSFSYGWARRHKQGHTNKGVEFLLDEQKKIPIQLFMTGEEMKDEKSPLLSCWRASYYFHAEARALSASSVRAYYYRQLPSSFSSLVFAAAAARLMGTAIVLP